MAARASGGSGMNVREIENWEDETEYDEPVVIYL